MKMSMLLLIMLMSCHIYSQTSIIEGVDNGSVISGDIDNDGDIDLIVSGYTKDEYHTRVYFNNKNGIFDEHFSYTLQCIKKKYNNQFQGYQTKMKLGDLDNDGFLDLLISFFNQKIGRNSTVIYWNNGKGVFKRGFINTFDQEVTGGIHIVDLNNDTYLDILLSEGYGINIYFNDGKGHFRKKNILGCSLRERYFPEIADFDNDGDIDILIYYYNIDINYGYADIMIAYNVNNEYIINDPLGCSLFYQPHIFIYDFDRDNKKDIFLTGDGFQHFIINNNGKLEKKFTDTVIGHVWGIIKIHDFDKNSIDDYVLTHISSYNVNKETGKITYEKSGSRIYMNYGTDKEQVIPIPWELIEYIEVTDLNNDTFLDFVILHNYYKQKQIVFFINDQHGGFIQN